MMHCLSNEQLLTTYYKSIELKLDEDFIILISSEILRRQIKMKHPASPA